MNEFSLVIDSVSALAQAREYPYAIPKKSFVYKDSGVSDFDPAFCAGRTPVLAIGSNQSPQRLAQKFGNDASHVIPVQRATLKHFDVVYSAHITTYGAVPAMLQISDGSEVELAVTWLDDAQLDIMHHSEVRTANYGFALLEEIELSFEDGGKAFYAHGYVSSRGHLRHDGDAVALSAIGCSGRRYRAMSTAKALEVIRERVAPSLDADTFVLRLVADDAYRHQVTMLLAADAVPFLHPFELLGE